MAKRRKTTTNVTAEVTLMFDSNVTPAKVQEILHELIFQGINHAENFKASFAIPHGFNVKVKSITKYLED